MRNKHALVLNNTIDMWNCEKQLKEIRGIISSTPLTDVEFSCLVQLGKATQLNPFMREIWAVKYTQGKAASIFIGRDGYRKAAQRDRDYEYHQVNAVYSKDEFKICNDEITHTYGFSNRGDLVGAYCIVKRKSSAKPTYVLVTMDEYNQRQSLWKDKPETMIKKVAEAQALRQAFQDLLAGTYSDAELPQETPKLTIVNKPEGATQTERLKNILNSRVHEEPIDTYVPLTPEQYGTAMSILAVSALPPERVDKALAHYNVDDIAFLSTEQAEDFINNLRKIHDKQSNSSG
jgi:phage recombination protein Bet